MQIEYNRYCAAVPVTPAEYLLTFKVELVALRDRLKSLRS